MKKIKLLQIIGDSTITGAPMVLLTLVKGLDKKKFSVTCACPPGPLAGMLKEVKGVKVETISMRSKWDLKAIKRLRRLIKSLNPKSQIPSPKLIVHCHGVRGGFLGRLASIGPRKTAPKVVYTEHLWTFDYKLKNPISYRLQIFGLWFLDLVTSKTITVSRAVADFLIKRRITRPEKVEVIYNGIEQPAGLKSKIKNKKSKIQIKDKKFTIGFVGSLVKRKGIEYLIRAMPELKLTRGAPSKNEKLKIVIIGEGPEKENLKKLAQKLKIDDIVDFKGFVENLDDIYPTLDVYVQPSLDEAFGIATLEAMSYGLPVIASNVGGLPELLNLSADWRTDKSDKSTLEKSKKPHLLADCGILVPPGNSAALSEAILKILKNEKLVSSLGRAAKKRAREFSAERMVKETEGLYLSLVE